MSARPIAVVTGGAGFIGSHTVDLLLARGYAVRVIDDISGGRDARVVRCLGRFASDDGGRGLTATKYRPDDRRHIMPGDVDCSSSTMIGHVPIHRSPA